MASFYESRSVFSSSGSFSNKFSSNFDSGFNCNNGSNLTLVADEKRAQPNAKGVINLVGLDDSGLVSTGDNLNTISFDNQRFVTKYVVDSSGDHTAYQTLEEAIDAANDDEKSHPCKGDGVSILLRCGTYELSDNLNTDKKIAFVDAGFGAAPVATITGQATSGGNKSWYGVKFADSDGDYNLQGASSCTQMTDSFCKTEFTQNFRVRTANDHLKFRGVNFNYDCLERNAVLQVSGGKGIFDDKGSCYTINRCNGDCNTAKFLQLNVDSVSSRSTIFNGVFNVNISDSPTFVTISLENRQQLIVQNTHFNYMDTVPEECHLFGYFQKPDDYSSSSHSSYYNHCCPKEPERQFNPQTRLVVYTSVVRSFPEGNLAVCANLWSGDVDRALKFHHCSFETAQVLRYELGVAEGVDGAWNLHKCVCEGNASDKPLSSMTLNSENDVHLALNSSTLRTNNPMAHFLFEQENAGNEGLFFLVGSAFQSSAAGNNPWLENNIDTITTQNRSNGRGPTVDVAGGSGANVGVFLDEVMV